MADFVSSNMLVIWISIAVVSVLAMYQAAKRLPKGMGWTALLAVLVVPLTILVGAVASFFVLLVWDANAATALFKDAGSGVAYLFETGMEYATPVFLVSAISTAYFRLRRT